MKKIILIDFDTAIAGFIDGSPRSVRPDTAEALEELRKNNYEIHVFSRNVPKTATVEKFLTDNNIPFDKVVAFAPFDIILSEDAITSRSRWEWNLEDIVLHKPLAQKDAKKTMHDAMQRYKKLAAKNPECICC